MAFGFHRRIARARVLLCLEMLPARGDGGLCRIEIGGRVSVAPATRAAAMACRASLISCTGALLQPAKPKDPDNHRNEAQHKGNGH